MNAPTPLSPDVLGSPEAIADPYPSYEVFRGPTPVRYMRTPAGPRTGLSTPLYSWALLRHADVMAALRDTATFSSEINAVHKALPKLALVHDDPPRHTHLRRLVSKAFSAQHIVSLSDWIGRIAHELIDSMGRGPVEFMAAYAAVLPLRVISVMLGIPEEHYPLFRRWSEATAAYRGMAAEERARKLQEMKDYMDQVIAARRAKPGKDLLSALVQAEIDGASLTDEEIHAFARVLLIAGHETTTNLIGNMAALLADRPELWRQVREDRTLVEPIIEEVLRYESPVQRTARVTTRPVRVGEAEIGAGELVDIFYGAANRDPTIFEEPAAFRPERKNLQHVAFGLGTHFCLGAQLVRLEAQTTLNALLDRFPAIGRGEGLPVRQQSAPLSLGYTSLPLVLD